MPETVAVSGTAMKLFTCNTVVVGSGAAGLNALDELHAAGVTDILIVTEGLNMGTSRNTGSDKQTYYKMTVAGDIPDSVGEMAETLFRGGAMNGDNALAEAAMSLRCFFKLVSLGVPFPHNRHGEYAGYKTDHDPRQRATSCGPLTSKFMTEKLEAAVRAKGIPIVDGCRVLAVATAPHEDASDKSIGLVALDTDSDVNNPVLVLFNCVNIVYAVGGPSAIYHASVYPESQTCATGAALEAGAEGVNLTESQYGIASTKFRWNLSGSYQQVLPRYISTDENGNDAREFLDGFFATPGAMLEAVFLKGYQWPFDPAKTNWGGSSLVDIAVYLERKKGRRVFLDYRENPSALLRDGKPDWTRAGETARTYLANSKALQDTPVQRLRAMNHFAYQLYRDNGIDLESEPLEAVVAAQHNNGGLVVDEWWESNLRHFFPVGEVAGTFGIHRPGGAALNSTQVGGARAALRIGKKYNGRPLAKDDFLALANRTVQETVLKIQALRKPGRDKRSPFALRETYQKTMDACGAFLRPQTMVTDAMAECGRRIASYAAETRAENMTELVAALVNWDILVTQYAYLAAIAEYRAHGGKSRGSALVCDSLEELDIREEKIAGAGLDVPLDGNTHADEQCVLALSLPFGGVPSCRAEWRQVRPIPENRETWFEKVYNDWFNGDVVS